MSKCINPLLQFYFPSPGFASLSNGKQVSCYTSFLSKIDEKAFSNYLNYLKTIVPNSVEESRLKVTLPKLLAEELGNKPQVVVSKLLSLKHQLLELSVKEMDLAELNNLESDITMDVDLKVQIECDKSVLMDEIATLKFIIADTIVEDKEVEKSDGVIIEVVPGVGGAEAMLFASDLFEMYQLFCERLGLQFDLINFEDNPLGGILSASAFISSPDGFAFKLLRYEGGTHRVQRVPETESQGRIHTSTANVVVMARQSTEASPINKKELDISFSRCGGSGGQSVQKSDSAARIVHRPTGITVRCEATRNQRENLNRALLKLQHILQKQKLDAAKAKEMSVRDSMIRSRERSDKIRTYNFPQDRVTDHRIGCTLHNVKAFLSGGSQLESVMQKLDEKFMMETKVAVINSLINESLGST